MDKNIYEAEVCFSIQERRSYTIAVVMMSFDRAGELLDIQGVTGHGERFNVKSLPCHHAKLLVEVRAIKGMCRAEELPVIRVTTRCNGTDHADHESVLKGNCGGEVLLKISPDKFYVL